MGSIYSLKKPVLIIRDDGVILHANKQTIKHPRFVLFDPKKHGPNGEKMKEAFAKKMSLAQLEAEQEADEMALLSDAPRRRAGPKPAEGLELGELCEDVELPVSIMDDEDKPKRGRPRLGAAG